MMNCEGCGRKWSWPNLWDYPGIFEGLSKTTKNLRIAGLLAEI
jgi:hypothetical protein